MPDIHHILCQGLVAALSSLQPYIISLHHIVGTCLNQSRQVYNNSDTGCNTASVAVPAGAYTKRSLPAPANTKELYDPVPGVDGALPFKMAHTSRMK